MPSRLGTLLGSRLNSFSFFVVVVVVANAAAGVMIFVHRLYIPKTSIVLEEEGSIQII